MLEDRWRVSVSSVTPSPLAEQWRELPLIEVPLEGSRSANFQGSAMESAAKHLRVRQLQRDNIETVRFQKFL